MPSVMPQQVKALWSVINWSDQLWLVARIFISVGKGSRISLEECQQGLRAPRGLNIAREVVQTSVGIGAGGEHCRQLSQTTADRSEAMPSESKVASAWLPLTTSIQPSVFALVDGLHRQRVRLAEPRTRHSWTNDSQSILAKPLQNNRLQWFLSIRLQPGPGVWGGGTGLSSRIVHLHALANRYSAPSILAGGDDDDRAFSAGLCCFF